MYTTGVAAGCQSVNIRDSTQRGGVPPPHPGRSFGRRRRGAHRQSPIFAATAGERDRLLGKRWKRINFGNFVGNPQLDFFDIVGIV